MRAALILLVLLSAGSALAQGSSAPCEGETRQLRWLVQHYAKQRADLEFHVSRLEAERQALQAEVDAMKTAPKGQK